MRKQTPEIFDTSTQKANLWLKDVQLTARHLTRFQAYSALRAVLHTLRDCLQPGPASKLAAQMPLLIKGVFFDGWKAHLKPERLSREEFLERIRMKLRGQANVDPSLALEAVVRALYRRITPGELDAARGVLPAGVRAAVQAAIAGMKADEGIDVEREAAASGRAHGRHRAELSPS